MRALSSRVYWGALRREDILLVAGMTCMWPFMTVSTQVHLWSPPIFNMGFIGLNNSSAVDYSLILALFFAIVFIFRNKLSRVLASSRAFLGLMGVAGSSGILLLTVPGLFGGSSGIISTVGIVLLAAFVAVYVVAWGIRTSRGDIRRLLLLVLLASIICRLLTTVYYLTGFNQSALFIIRPFLSGLFLLLMPDVSENLGLSDAQSLRVAPWVTIVPIILLSLFTSALVQLLAGYQVGAMSDLAHIINSLLIVAVASAIAVYVHYRLRTIDDLLLVFALFFIFCSVLLLAIYFFPGLYNWALAIRVSLVMFLWVVFAYTASNRRLSPMALFPILGFFAIAPLGMRLFDYAGFLSTMLRSGFTAPILAIATFVVSCAVVIYLVRHRLRIVTAPSGAKEDRQSELCERATLHAGLTPREFEVVRMASRGYSAKSIAKSLFLSEQTVKNHLSNSYRKLEVHSKQELINLIDSYR